MVEITQYQYEDNDALEITQAEGGEGKIVARLFTPDVKNRNGNIIVKGALDTTEYQDNPLLLWNHDREMLPIGTATTIKRYGVDFAELHLDMEDDMARRIKGMIDRKILRAVSINARILDYECLEDEDDDYWFRGLKVKQCSLLEISVVNVPGDRTTLMQSLDPVLDKEYKEYLAAKKAAVAESELADTIRGLRQVDWATQFQK